MLSVSESLTYSSSSELYVSARRRMNLAKNPYVGICKNKEFGLERFIPLIHSLGTSIVNGLYRIVISQILQSLGIYLLPV